jgi:RpiR family murPQ operon transcriptional repressor
MDCITKLKEMSSSFTKTEKKISEYILNNLDRIKPIKAKELSDEIGISQPSIIRFAKKLGYKGFPEFKIALNEAIITKQVKKPNILHDKISLSDTNLEIIKKVGYQNIEAIKNTISINNLRDIEKVVKLIGKAEKIFVIGAGFSGLVAKNFMYKLLEIGINVSYMEDSHIQLTNMNNTTSRDLVFAISHSGETYETVKSVEIAKKNKAKIVSLTKVMENPLSKLSDINLKTVAENVSYRLTAISSTITQLTIIDTIFILLSKLNFDKNIKLSRKNTETVKIQSSSPDVDDDGRSNGIAKSTGSSTPRTPPPAISAEYFTESSQSTSSSVELSLPLPSTYW